MSLTAIKQEDGKYIVVNEDGSRACVEPYFCENGEWKFTPFSYNESLPVSDKDHAEALRRVIRKEKLEKLLS